MKLALIPPFVHLQDTNLTNMQLMLPHLINNSLYANTYKKLGARDDQFVILDNGVAEGMQVLFKDIIDIGKMFKVNELVLPDVMGHAVDTLEVAREGYYEAKAARWDACLMYVAQGQTLREVCTNIQAALALMPRITTIGIPRHLPATTGVPNIRQVIVDEIIQWPSMMERTIHFLGMSSMNIKEMEYKSVNRVRSVDSSAPYNYAFRQAWMDDGGEYNRPSNYFTQVKAHFDPHVLKDNIQYLLETVEGR